MKSALVTAGLLSCLGLGAAAEEADPFAALTAAVSRAPPRYVAPDADARVIDAARLRLSPELRGRTATEPLPGADAKPAPPPARPAPDPAPLQPAVHPEFARRPKNFALPQSTIHGLVVLTGANGMMVGDVMDIIGTVSPGPGQIAFARPIGREMGISCEEARRAAQVRYPAWEPARITISFGEKYSAKDGGSAGGAFALLFLSLLDGLAIDNNFAMTGDVTVDWRIRKVGAVAEKVRGAGRAGRTLVAVPKENEREIADMLLLYPPETLLDVQVLGVSDLGEVVEWARADRAAERTRVLDRYRGVQQLVRRSSILALSRPGTLAELEEVLKAAPNHLSAKYLLLYAQGRNPARLSLATSMQQVVACTGSLLVFLTPVTPTDIDMPDDSYRTARQSLYDLRHKLDRDAEPLHAALLAFVSTLDQMHKIQTGNDSASLKQSKLKVIAVKVDADRKKVLTILRRLQENKEFLERIMGE
jgi:hypothetical protein